MVQVRFQTPAITETDARRFAHELYGLDVTATELPSERDRNFRLKTPNGDEFVLKISNVAETRAALDLQHRVLAHLDRHVTDLTMPRLVPTTTGRPVTLVTSADGAEHLVRLLTYVPGRVWADVSPHSPELLRSLGFALGSIDAALLEMEGPEEVEDFKWDLTRAGWIRPYLPLVADEKRPIIERLLARYEVDAHPRLASLRAGLLYNDANDYNVLVQVGRVTSFIDYGDMCRGPLVCDLAIAIAYAILHKPDPLAAAAQIVAGYHEASPLTDADLAVLFPLICARLSVSVVNAAYQRHAEPANEYLLISETPAWTLLERLDRIHPRLAYHTFRAACGWPARPETTTLIDWLRRRSATFGPIVDVDLRTSSIVLDLSVGTDDFGTLSDLRDPATLTRLIAEWMSATGAGAAIGRYDEPRLLYTGDLFASAGNDGPERRTLHIGLDVFMDAGSVVRTPLDGIVHSVVDNAGPLNYGPTIILEHAPDDGPRFFTLYGHLSRESLTSVRAGHKVAKGEVIATLGDVEVNGGWAPHLHFQIVADMLDYANDFPGVAPASQRAVWTSLSPDPNLIVGIPPSRFPPAREAAGAILASRRETLGRNLSLAYREPLHIVRGYAQYLYDATGRAYLDAVNNVAHVGHCHPRVVNAGQRQMTVLNTNSRYLHEHITRYAERLRATLPDPLRVCYFVNSGSEAVELALRLARAHTRSRATVVLDGAYHGNTSALVEVSPYKYDGNGGEGQARHVRKVPMPDPFRGSHRRDDQRAGEKYAADVRGAFESLGAAGFERGTFLVESLMGSSGQIVLPDGYLTAAFTHARAAGAVCVADEVQVGFGRVGSHFWGFQTQGVVPDIVAFGKPAGNGHPLGGVITTPDIAASFDNGMEYFSTFGGNPVSCAIGLAVLDVIDDEKLQSNAQTIGDRLRGGFEALSKRHPIIGDVRGLGLFLGVELVRDRTSLDPAPDQTAYVTHRLMERGVLVSVDGPLKNVLKIKPPLVFSSDDADRFVETLDVILAEDAGRP